MIDYLRQEWASELKSTRRVLERVPEDRLAWKPHGKSMALGDLATHVANIPSWAGPIFTQDRFEMPQERMEPFGTVAALLAAFDKNAADMAACLETATEDILARPWTFVAGGKEIFTMPKALTVRTFLLNHLIHHRAQLTVYLRLLDVPVPGVYGPSADELT